MRLKNRSLNCCMGHTSKPLGPSGHKNSRKGQSTSTSGGVPRRLDYEKERILQATMMSIMDNNRTNPSVADAMQSCEKNSSSKGDSAHSMRFLPDGFEPGEHDVLCGRGRKCFNHPGNVRFRDIVQSFLAQYSKAMTKLEKSYILSDVVEKVRNNSGIGGFVKKNEEGRWYEVGDFLAREKTSQAFRDVLHDKYKSSNTSKKKRRQEEQAEKLFRGQSNRSLDSPSVHTAGSTAECDYSVGNDSSKLMRVERPNLVGFMVEEPTQEDLLGALDVQLSTSFGGRKGLASQRSQRSVMEFDKRQAMMRQAKSSSSSYNYSCPNLFRQPNAGIPAPRQSTPVDHAAIPTQVVLEDSVMEPTPIDSMISADASYSSLSRGMDFNIGRAPNGLAHPGQPPRSDYTHHSQPNLFAAQNAAVAGRRRQFARMPPRHNSSRNVMGRQGSLRNVMGRQNSLQNVLGRQNSAHSVLSGPPGSHLLGNSSQHSQNPHMSMSNLSSNSSNSRHSMTVFEEQLDNLALSDRSNPQIPQQPMQPMQPMQPRQPSRAQSDEFDIDELVLSPMAGETKDTLLASLASLSDSFAIEPIDENPFDPVQMR